MGLSRLGIAGAAAWIFLAAGCGNGKPDAPPHIILFTLESLRADHVGSYGYPLPVSPNLDRFAEEAIRFNDAHAVTSWTLTSHASLLTGLYPAAHQVLEPGDRLAGSHRTIAEVLGEMDHHGEGGYETAAFVSGPFLRAAHNLHQGFDLYDDSTASPGESASHGDITNPAMEEKLVSFLRSAPAGPFFLFAYFWDIHYDYLPPSPYDTLFVPHGAEKFDLSRFEFNDEIREEMSRERLQYVTSQYDGEIRCTDEMLGRIFRVLREEGLWDNSLIIVTADHGEEFFDHGGKGHKNNLYVESVHVPLLIKPPGDFEPYVDTTLASLVDIFSTVLEAAAGRAADQVPGSSLLDRENRVRGQRRFFDLALPLHALVDGRIVATRLDRWRAIRTDRHKYIQLPRDGGEQLFFRSDDPAELRNRAGDLPALCDTLRTELDRWQEEMERSAEFRGDREKAELSEGEEKRLKALGYIQ